MIKILYLILFCSLSSFAMAQRSMVRIYEAQNFDCDRYDGTASVNICSGERAVFADSLLNSLYRKIIRQIDKEIAGDNRKLQKLQTKGKQVDSSDLYYVSQSLRYNKRMKDAIVTSQRLWTKMRDANLAVEVLLCEGGTGCTAITNEARIGETLERIEKLESFGLH